MMMGQNDCPFIYTETYMDQQTKDVIYGIINHSADNTLLHNNANKASERIPVMRDMIAGEVSKLLALEEILPTEVSSAHKAGELHYHDLDYAPLFPMFNCMLVDLENMLTKGFKMGNAEIETPKSISTATAITAQVIAQVASHIYGGTTIDRVDEVLAPYVKKSYLKHLATGKRFCKDEFAAQEYADQEVRTETYNAMQGLEYEINTLHTANGQTPFTTLGFGLGLCRESRLIQECILKVRMRGLGKNQRTAIFPKLVYGIKEGVNRKQGDPNYYLKKLALECAAKRMYPDILNYDKTVEVTGSYKAPMGCRSFLSDFSGDDGTDYLAGRNNMGVVSINLTRIALESNSLHGFYSLLAKRLDVCKLALDTRVDRLRTVKAEVAPILYTEGACGIRLKPDELVFNKLFAEGRATISLGYIGLHETVNALLPEDLEHPFESKAKQELAKSIVEVLSKTTEAWKEKSGLAFSLYSTPSESLCDRFCRLDEKEFGTIDGVTDKGYYTNSFHLDVNKTVSQFSKLDFEEGYAELATGGHISYVEYPRVQLNLQMTMLETVWDYSYNKIPYLGSNVPIDECYDCGYQGDSVRSEEGFTCPHCGGKNISVTKRVCGYLGSPDSRPFIQGKQMEVVSRVKHT